MTFEEPFQPLEADFLAAGGFAVVDFLAVVDFFAAVDFLPLVDFLAVVEFFEAEVFLAVVDFAADVLFFAALLAVVPAFEEVDLPATREVAALLDFVDGRATVLRTRSV